MANTEAILTTPLQVSPNACGNCVDLAAIGQKTPINASFSAHFDSSVKQFADSVSGIQLPEGGKLLPQDFFSSSSLPYDTDLHAFVSNLSGNGSDTFALDDFVLNEASNQLLDLEVIEEEINILPVGIEANSLDLSVVETSEDARIKVNTQLEDGSDVLLLIPGEPSHARPAESYSNAVSTDVTKTVIPSSVTNILYEQTGSIKGEVLVHESPIDDAINTQGRQQSYLTNTNLDKLENFAKLSGLDQFVENKFDLLLGDQVKLEEIDNLQIGLSARKVDATIQIANPVILNDSAQRLNTGVATGSVVDAPLTLNLKNNLSSELSGLNIEQSIAQNIKWLLGNKIQNANINIHPESLGHINVSINIEESKLAINFMTTNTVTKDVIESNLSGLRDQLAENGIDLQEVNVRNRFSDQTGGQSPDTDRENLNSHDDYSNSYSLHDSTDDIHSNNLKVIHSSLHLIDAYV